MPTIKIAANPELPLTCETVPDPRHLMVRNVELVGENHDLRKENSLLRRVVAEHHSNISLMAEKIRQLELHALVLRGTISSHEAVILLLQKAAGFRDEDDTTQAPDALALAKEVIHDGL